MTLPAATEDHYRGQQRLQVSAMALIRALWATIGLDAEAGWREIAARALLVVSSAQLGAATAGAAYVPKVLRELGVDADAFGEVNPRRLVGVASDGRPLETLLRQPLVRVQYLVGERGMDPVLARVEGGKFLDRIVQTQVQDAARVSTGVSIAASPKVTGYVRMLNPPTCSRCVLLAGVRYKWNKGFERHPRCDCRHIPASEDVAGDLLTDPLAYFKSRPPAEQDRVFGKAGAQAIRDGSSISMVVNARRGMSTAAKGFTTEGVTRRGLAGSRLGTGRQRMMPESIYKVAGDDRMKAVELLKLHGYIL
jgi:hypothetical protein